MKKVVLSVVAALAVAAVAVPAFAADVAVKAPKAPPPPPNPWDLAFGSAIGSDYMFRGITQSGHEPSAAAYFEPHYNVNPNLQLYAGIASESIKFANGAAAEVDFYGGVRPTFGPLAFDFGIIDYYYPGGNSTASVNGVVFTVFSDASFYEVYGKGTWTATDWLAIGGNVFYTPNWLATGAPGTYYSGTVKLTAPSAWLPSGIGMYVSGEVGRQDLGTIKVDNWVYVPAQAGTGLPSYTTWNVGLGFTWKVFTLDLRYTDTNLSKENCFILTGDPGAPVGGVVSTLNPTGNTSDWCGGTFVAKLSADLTLDSLK
jgi:uncharacterized protein (TIGR02001 family)